MTRTRPVHTSCILVVALACALACIAGMLGPAVAGAEPSTHPFEIEAGSFHITSSTGSAGAHENLTTSFNLAHNGTGKTFNDVKTTVVNLPAGFAGNNNAVPTCTFAQLIGKFAGSPECPPASQVGTIRLELTIASHVPAKDLFPVYNMEVTTPGVAAQLGFDAVVINQLLNINVRPNDLGLTVTSLAIQDSGEAHEISVTTWGVPWAHEHDAERGMSCYEGSGAREGVAECHGGGEEVTEPPRPFLAMPTSCGGALTASVSSNAWEQPSAWSEALTEVSPVSECERVPFNPSIEAKPTTSAAESPSGFDLTVEVPQSWEHPEGIATSDLKDAVVTLPEGYTVNPSAGAGLAACTPEELGRETAASLPGEGCPPESKLGTVKIETPLLAESVNGAVYLATPHDNPFGSLLALYVVAKDPARGILVKVSGRVEPNPVTGQLVTTFPNNPQVPFSKFTFSFHQGATSPLVSPPACGTYSASAQLTPWSDPGVARVLSSAFPIEHGVQGGPCPSGGVPPFNPQVISGTENNAGGSYSPFYLRIERHDGEQEITGFGTQLPPGLTGNLSGIEQCSEAEIQRAREQTGAQAETNPACPASSEIGRTIAEAGVGTVLAQTPGRLYLGGPLEGAPFSVVSITSAKVGPFDLGTVVVHLPLFINPITAAVSIPSGAPDQIPHIIKGIVIHLRAIRVYIDRPDFMINPTSCEPMNVGATVVGVGANFADPADADPVTISEHFQAADCSSLKFKPEFSVSTSAKTSRVDGASLTAKLTVPSALGTQANIGRVKVELPEQLPSRLPTLQKACTAAQFDTNPAGCPPASIIGHAKAITPILPVPLEGPAYFVSHGGEGWPSLVVVLQGYGVTIDLVGTTFISKAGVTSTTFKTVPDQPVTSFELTLPEGPYSALTALGNLCTATKTVTVKKKVTVKVHGHRKTITRKVKQTEPATLQMPTEFVAQNGAEIHQTTPITVTGCPKTKKTAHKKTAKAR